VSDVWHSKQYTCICKRGTVRSALSVILSTLLAVLCRDCSISVRIKARAHRPTGLNSTVVRNVFRELVGFDNRVAVVWRGDEPGLTGAGGKELDRDAIHTYISLHTYMQIYTAP